MKTAILSLVVLLGLVGAGRANANALASIYNGDQFQLNDQLLVQDADHPDDFYILPRTFHIKRQSTYNADTGEVKNIVSVNNRVLTSGQNQYSDYSIRVVLDEPGRLELLQAAMNLRRVANPNARIKGVAPICGMHVLIPGISNSTEAPNPASFDPNTTFIQYSLGSTDGDKCNSVLATSEFTFEYRVPISLEPATARNLTSDVGLVLQPIDMILPYKYKDKVKIVVDARSAVEQMKAAASLQGSFKFVTAGVQASMEKMMNSLQVTGQLHVDCQNPDTTACDRFVNQAQDILTKVLVNYLPMSGAGDTNPLVVADKNRAVNATMFQVQLNYDQQSAERIGQFTVDFSNTVYSSVHAQAQIDASHVPVEVLAPAVRKLLESGT